MTIKFTHTDLIITDIKKIKSDKADFYKLKFKGIDKVISVSASVFEPRLCNHFMKDSINYISRDEILSCKYNVNITQGFYYRLDAGKLTVKASKFNNMYINFIDVACDINDMEEPYFSKYIVESATVAM